MIGWARGRLDRLVAAAIVLGCASLLVWRIVPGRGQAASAADMSAAAAEVSAAAHSEPVVEVPAPSYHRNFLGNMSRCDGTIAPELVDGAFFPTVRVPPPPPPPPPPETFATQKEPTIGARLPTMQRCTLAVGFGDAGGIWRHRALQIWRRPTGTADWPDEPFLTIKVSADGAGALPPGVTATKAGYAVSIDDQKPRAGWEYRVRAAAVFPETVTALHDGKSGVFMVKLPDDPDERLDLLRDDAAAPGVSRLLLGGQPAFAPLGGGPFFSRFVGPVELKLPGDTQISYEAPVTIDGRESANFRIRHHRAGAFGADADGWCARLERFKPGDDIRVARWQMVFKDPAGGRDRREAVAVDSGFRLVRLFTRAGSGLAPERVALLKDLTTGMEVNLVARADGGGWWPNDPPLATEGGNVDPTAPAVPAPQDGPQRAEQARAGEAS